MNCYDGPYIVATEYQQRNAVMCFRQTLAATDCEQRNAMTHSQQGNAMMFDRLILTQTQEWLKKGKTAQSVAAPLKVSSAMLASRSML